MNKSDWSTDCERQKVHPITFHTLEWYQCSRNTAPGVPSWQAYADRRCVDPVVFYLSGQLTVTVLYRWSRWSASKKSMSMRLMGRCAQTWTWTGLILHQREASSTACSEERQVLVLRQLSEGVGAKVPALFLLSFSSLFFHSGLVQVQHVKWFVSSAVTPSRSWLE